MKIGGYGITKSYCCSYLGSIVHMERKIEEDVTHTIGCVWGRSVS